MRELCERIDAREVNEWIAYDKLDPIGYERFDHLAAMLAADILAPHCKDPPKPKDLLPKWGGKVKQTPKQVWQTLKAILPVYGPDGKRKR